MPETFPRGTDAPAIGGGFVAPPTVHEAALAAAPVARPIFFFPFSSHAGLRFGLCNDPGAKVFADAQPQLTSPNLG